MYSWRKNIVHWKINLTHYFSIPFTWLVPKALEETRALNGKKVIVGGPGAVLMRDMFKNLASVENSIDICEPLLFHNPLATFTTRGCPRRCSFCAVPRLEGNLVELENWVPRPMVCDNNLLAASRRHFDRVIDRLKILPFVDFNQGLDARLFNAHHASRLAEIKTTKLRFAFDHISVESAVADAIALARKHGHKKFGIYVLIGYKDTPDDARYRLEKVREWGIRPNPMRYQPLDALEKNKYIPEGWTRKKLSRMTRYYWNLRRVEHIPFEDFLMEEPELFK